MMSVNIIDLSHPISAAMPVWPGTQGPEFHPLASIATDGYAELSLCMSSHTGTHIDAPAHMIDGGATLDRFPADHFFGRAFVVTVPELSDRRIGLDLLEPLAEQIESAEYLLLHTNWSKFWGQAGYDQGYPVLDESSSEWLAGFSLKGIGVDAPSFDLAESHDYPVHRRLLSTGMILVENLANLQHLPPAGSRIALFPLPIERAEACPVRGVALI